MAKEQVAKIRHAILKKIEGLDDETLNTKPSADTWSVMQILDHLHKMELTIAEGVAKTAAKNQQKKALNKPLQLTLVRKLKVKAPKHVVPEDSYVTSEEMKTKLNNSRNRLYEVFTATDAETLRNNSMSHPVFGNVPLAQWFPFVGYHEKRHLAQLEETLRKVDDKKN